MDFKDSIKQLSDRVLKLKDNILTEEATKMRSLCLSSMHLVTMFSTHLK